MGLARFPTTLLAEAERHGMNRAELSGAVGISEARLHDPDARVPRSWAIGIWRELAKRDPDPALGVRWGSRRCVRELGLVGYTMLHSATLRDALERLARYGQILVDHAEVSIAKLPQGGLRVDLAFDPALDDVEQPIDYALAWVVSVCRELTRAPIVPLEVGFPYPRSAKTYEHARAFGRNQAFDARKASIAFSPADAARAVLSAEHELGAYLDQLANRTLASLGAEAGSLPDRVRRAIWGRMHGTKPSLEQVARSLGIGSRSLQRRLGEDKTTYAALLDEVRHTMAARLLLERDVSIGEIGYLLGYSDASAFHRAFLRWEGTGPKQFRRRRRNTADGVR
jgi:AraC-like DNA-binding protein